MTGSWNKATRVGYEVIRVPLHQTVHASGEYEDFLTGFVLPNGQVWGRPVGITLAPDGSLPIEEELGATYWESLDQMLARMDIISVNCPHTPATFQLLSARRLKLIRKDAFIVNTARGEVIDEETLTKLIESGDIAGAGLDVYENEPAVNPKLVRLAKAGKVTLLPHMGSATIEGRVEMGEKVIINIRTFLDNHKPPDRVLPGML